MKISSQKCSKIDPKINKKAPKVTPGAPLRRGLGTYLGALGKRPLFGVNFGASWAPRGTPWGTLVGPIFALGPSLAAPKEPGEPIFSHLG